MAKLNEKFGNLGRSKRRTCRKVYLAIDENCHDLLAYVVTTNNADNVEALKKLLEKIERTITSVTADSTYDTRETYKNIR